LDLTHTASAIPKLKDGPTVADEVQIPIGISSGLIFKASFSLKEESPANIPDIYFIF